MHILTLLLGFVFGDLVFETTPLPTPVVRDAILRLAPRYQVGPRLAKQYARIVQQEARRRKVDPLLVVSFIQVETARKWNPRLKSPTNDFGLTQVHVAVNGSARFLGREEELYDPRTNVREWVRLAAMWRAYHQRECEVHAEICYSGPEGPWGCNKMRIAGSRHPWWAHLKWGYRVKNTEHAQKVTGVYRWLLQQFHHLPESS